MKTAKIILILAVIALLVAGPAAAGGKARGVSPALLLFPDASSETALTKDYRDDPLYQQEDTHPLHMDGYVVPAGTFVLNIYNQGKGKRGETAKAVQLVMAVNDLDLFTSATLTVNGASPSQEINKESFVHAPATSPEPGTPRLWSDKRFPRHGVFPAYYVEIGLGDIALGEAATVEVAIIGDPEALLIHFDAYARGENEDCGGKGRGRGKGPENCAQKFDIRNKLSHDVTQVGGTQELRVIYQNAPAAFSFSTDKIDTTAGILASAIILNSDDEEAVIGDPEYNPDAEFNVATDGFSAISVQDSTVLWPSGRMNPTPLPGDFTLMLTPSEAALGNYILKVCITEDAISNTITCEEYPFKVEN